MLDRFKSKKQRYLSTVFNSDWNKLFEIFTKCAHCNICRDTCPIFIETQKETNFPGGRARALLTYHKEKLSIDQSLFQNLFLCTNCGQCDILCPLEISITEYMEVFRSKFNQTGIFHSLKHLDFKKLLDSQSNPYNESQSKRGDWKLPILNQIEHALKKRADHAFFIGCTAAFRDQESAQHTALILSRVLPDGFVILDEEEFCCGSPLLRTGNAIKPQYIQHNITLLKEKGVKILITSCAGCFKTIAKDWPKIIKKPLPFEILHISQFCEKYLTDLLPLLKSTTMKVTYHDPCHLGRAMAVYESPRTIIKAFPGIKLKEMSSNKKHALCCGAGGGVKINYPDTAKNLAKRRIKQAISTNVDCLVTSCVFCKYNLLTSSLDESDSSLPIYNLENLIFSLFKN